MKGRACALFACFYRYSLRARVLAQSGCVQKDRPTDARKRVLDKFPNLNYNVCKREKVFFQGAEL